jgi:hypothetical protein
MTGWARCNFDGRPLSPEDAAVMRDFAATLRARKDDRAVQWRELVEGEPPGTYWREWHCPQPLIRQSWRPVHAQWGPPGEDGIPVWQVFEIELAPFTLGE